MKFLCWLGFHKWVPTEEENVNKCARCSKEQIVVYAVMESELSDMVKKGQLSLAGYMSATKKGYITKSDFDLRDEI